MEHYTLDEASFQQAMQVMGYYTLDEAQQARQVMGYYTLDEASFQQARQ